MKAGPRGPRLRVTVISHALVVPSNRARWERIAELYDDVDVTVIVPAELRTQRYGSEQTFRPHPERRANYSVMPLRTWTTRSLYRSLARELKLADSDVVQINEEPTEWVLLQALVDARLNSPRAVRLFYYYSNLFFPPDAPWNRAKFWLDFRLADAALVGSTASEGVLRELGFMKECHVQTELGVDERVWRPVDERSDNSPFTIGFVGPLLPEKGIADLARGLKSLTGTWELVVCGDGPERLTLHEELSDLSPGQAVKLLGLVHREDLPAIVRSFDVLVLPSRSTARSAEQFGLVLAEAMVSGVAVIGSDCGAIPEVIDDAGLVFPQSDWRALAEQLALLRDRPMLRAELARLGRRRALENWSVTALATQTYELYRELQSHSMARAR